MNKKTKVAIIFGGESPEHEVSVQSARNVIEALDKNKYDVVPVCIDKNGRWQLLPSTKSLAENKELKALSIGNEAKQCLPTPHDGQGRLIGIESGQSLADIDVAFPILHGPLGEDGSIQGLFQMAHIPYVGTGVLGSAIGLDKDVMKRLLRDASIPIADFVVLSSVQDANYSELAAKLGEVLFVKPANMGSSVGISKVKSADEFEPAISKAFQFDKKVLVEEFVNAREIEVAVLGNEDPIASLPGEILPQHEFYSYEAKYVDENGAILETPANLNEDEIKRFQDLAIKTFKVLCGRGMTRVDFFYQNNGEILVNEVNTIPGFTRISQYPRMWEASGVSYPELIDRLIQLALHD